MHLFALFHTIGSSLKKCTFSGQQCCSKFTIALFETGINAAINNYAPDFISGFPAAQHANNKLRNATEGIFINITLSMQARLKYSYIVNVII